VAYLSDRPFAVQGLTGPAAPAPATVEAPTPPPTPTPGVPRHARPAPLHHRGPQHRRRRRRRRLPRWLTVIGWIVTLPLVLVAVMRIVAWDELEPFAVLNSVTFLIYLPAWGVAVVTLIGRRFLLAAVAAFVVAAQIAFMLPELTAAEPVPAWAATAPSIRLLDANVYYENPSMAGYAREIKAFKPQLVTMEEAEPIDVTRLQRSGALAHLPYHDDVAIGKSFFMASTYPLTEEKNLFFDGYPLIIEATVNLPSGPQRVWMVHTTAPYPVSFTLWKGQLAFIATTLAHHGPDRLLIVGDFNATWNSRGFRHILSLGMQDAAAARGHPFAMTWSQTKRPLPPLVRIDHVLTGPDVTATKIQTGDGPGSDHRDLMATVAFRPTKNSGGSAP
jgi:endonuclease/exonuclease/phosphatase (EEP) superfamily protein YafD